MSEEQDTQTQNKEEKSTSGKKVIKGIAIGGAIGSLIACIFAFLKRKNGGTKEKCSICQKIKSLFKK